MSDETVLAPEEIKQIEFYGDTITAALVRLDDDARIYVPIRTLCTYLGLDWSSQRQRVMRDDVLAEGVVIITIPSSGGPQDAFCLPLDLLPGWLFGISASRVKPELRQKITRYRRECFRVLWDTFKYEILPTTEQRPITGSGAALAYELATAVANLAREQMQFEQRLNDAARWASGIEAA